jgi:hypothetical protein
MPLRKTEDAMLVDTTSSYRAGARTVLDAIKKKEAL